eukprot:TRINITY_DN1841_c0_g4_i1.p1 TRINITY_DN1841_c0_g4~~TRINITY_DN1841_c0_g4_i1.p1  ORF type:complete len:342 (+),score=73.87 TRINITY_DN1841_c0_g4_i1:49-1026(+)
MCIRDRSESVFKDFMEDTEESLRKMMEADVNNGKFARFLKTTELVTEFKDILLNRYYRYLKGAFTYQISEKCRDYPGMSMLEFGHFCEHAQVTDAKLRVKDIDRIFIASNFETTEVSENPDNRFCRFEFVEAMLRLSVARFPDMQSNKVPATEIFTRFMEEIIGDRMVTPFEETEGFRQAEIYTLGVNDVLAANIDTIDQIYRKYKERQNFLSLENIRTMIRDASLELSSKEIIKLFSYSKMSIINELDSNKSRISYTSMQFVEFLEFLVRLANQCFNGSEEEKMPLHLKVNELMEALAALVGSTKSDFVDQPEYYDSYEQDYYS